MKLKNSPKIFENYKSDIPENTIKNIEDGFGRLGLELKYIPDKNVNGINVFKGVCKANHTFIKTCGKGETPVLAKASAYAEMAERISSGFFFESVRNLNRRKDLFRNIKIDEEAFAKLKKHEFIAGYCYEKTGDSRNILPEQFIPNTPLQLKDRNILLTSSISKHHWVNGYSLSRNENVKVPIKFVFEIGWTTGQASGNTFEEAIAQGSCEIFERYCFSYVMHRRIPVPTIDLNTIKNPKIKQQISFYNEHNIEVVIKDFSLGNRFPVVGILFIDHNIENERNILKKDKFFQLVNPGSALNIEEAISRCFTERNQAVDPRLFSWTDAIWKHWVLNMGKDYRGAYANHNDSRHYLNDGDLSFLTDNKSRVISFDNLKDTFPRHTDFYDDVKYILDICKKENKELIIVNTQHSKIRFPSVWVVIPEMMWIHEGLKNENSVFLDYSLEDSWFDDNDKIKTFIRKAEDYISCNLYYPEIKTIFGNSLSLFRILGIANLRIKNYGKSLEYFRAAKELENSSVYDVMINRLKTRDVGLAEEASRMKNPFVYGWNFEERATNGFIIPVEIDRIVSRFL